MISLSRLLWFLLAFLFRLGTSTGSNLHLKIEKYLREPKQDFTLLQNIIKSGKLNGLYQYEEVIGIFKYLTEKYPDQVKTKVIGSSYNKQEIFSYELSQNFQEDNSNKNQILFTGAHHARELLTASMIVKIFIENLHSLIHMNENLEFWKFTNLLIVPIVNIDSYKFITDSFGTENWSNYSQKRKNMNPTFCGDRIVYSGVDINRNYGFHYGETSEDTNECSQTFRGNLAFSEPETKAIRNLVDNNPNIVSAMNFHAFGNMWIHPFNYMHEPGKYPVNIDQKYIDFYKDFGVDVSKVTKTKYGNAIEMVNYSTDGEASDWMLGEKRIVSFSPELGSFNPKAQSFYIPQDLIFEVIQENYKVIDLFLKRNIFKVTKFQIGIINKKQLFLSFRNSGLSNLKNPLVAITSANKQLLRNINQITFENQLGDPENVENLKFDEKDQSLIFTLSQINRLEKFTIYFDFIDPVILSSDLAFNMNLRLINGDSVHLFEVKTKGYSSLGQYVIFMVLFSALCLIIISFVNFKFYLRNNKLRNRSTSQTA